MRAFSKRAVALAAVGAAASAGVVISAEIGRAHV